MNGLFSHENIGFRMIIPLDEVMVIFQDGAGNPTDSSKRGADDVDLVLGGVSHHQQKQPYI